MIQLEKKFFIYQIYAISDSLEESKIYSEALKKLLGNYKIFAKKDKGNLLMNRVPGRKDFDIRPDSSNLDILSVSQKINNVDPEAHMTFGSKELARIAIGEFKYNVIFNKSDLIFQY